MYFPSLSDVSRIFFTVFLRFLILSTNKNLLFHYWMWYFSYSKSERVETSHLEDKIISLLLTHHHCLCRVDQSPRRRRNSVENRQIHICLSKASGNEVIWQANSPKFTQKYLEQCNEKVIPILIYLLNRRWA